MDPTTIQIGRLIASNEELSSLVRQMLSSQPVNARIWLTPGELAKLIGCSTRTIQNYRSAGVFREGSFRARGMRGYEFHKNLAPLDIEAHRISRQEVE